MKKPAQVYQSTRWGKESRVTKVADGFEFTEGALWHPDNYFLFSDTPANCIYQLFPDGTLRLYLRNSGLTHQNLEQLSDQTGSNGLALDAENNLFICQHGNHAIAMMNKKKEVSTVIKDFNGAPFNSPNDITFRSDGILYFTDPPYGLSGQVLHPEVFQPHAGIYSYYNHKVELVATDLKYPNGLCFSPDEKWLYVSSAHPDEPTLLRYSVNGDGSLQYEGVLLRENADGITIDRVGNIYMAVKEGILKVSAAGEKMGMVALPDMPTNLAWDNCEEILFVTAASCVYMIAG